MSASRVNICVFKFAKTLLDHMPVTAQVGLSLTLMEQAVMVSNETIMNVVYMTVKFSRINLVHRYQ